MATGTAAPHDALVLVNALALRARWERPFPPHATLPRPFTPAVGATVPVATMQRPLPPDDVWTVGGVTVVELPCRAPRGRRPARVRFALGPAGAGAAEVVPATWARRGRGPDADVVELRLPRFELRGRLDLAEHLRALGASVALTPAADFSGLSAARPFVAQVVQEALVRVAEKGVEAAAVTALGMRAAAVTDRRRRVVVAFDRPFAVAVLDASGRVPLVVGWQATVPKGRQPRLDDLDDLSDG
ncbi:MAG TPA: serpin family protein [Frankiaceae bacterium]|nr:serpin family protein [Frankiaceae bacterium]